jgi:glycosyltransferase involved in cell wall biosynthesis
MNILILTDYYPPDKIGGVGEIAKNLKQAYENHGHIVYVLTTGRKTKQETSRGIFRSSKSLIWGIFLNNILTLYLIRKYKIEMVNMHQSSTSLFLLAKILQPITGFPLVISSFQVTYFSEFSEINSVTIEGITFKPRLKEYVEKYIFAPFHITMDLFAYLLADVVTVVSKESKKEIQNTYGKIKRKLIKVIPNGVSDLKINQDHSHHNFELEKKIQDKKVLMYIGVFRIRKRVFNLLFALKKALKIYKNLILIFVGGGRGYERTLQNLARELNLDKNVFFVGTVPNEDVPYYLSRADIFCMPSSYEGLPVAILEAMSMGKVVLTSNVSGMIDVIEDSVTGKLIRVDDIDGITDAITELVEDEDNLREMGKKAREIAINKYQWTDIAKSYIELII